MDTEGGLRQFLDDWHVATHPKVDGHPILRVAQLHPDRVPVIHRRVEGVPDEVLAAYDEEQALGSERVELRDLVASYGGTLDEEVSRATSLAMTRAPEGGYRVYEIDAAGERTGFDLWYETLEVAIRMCALGYGSPPGTLTWKEVPGNWEEATALDWVDDALEHLDLARTLLEPAAADVFDTQQERDTFCGGVLSDTLDSLNDAIAILHRDIAKLSY